MPHYMSLAPEEVARTRAAAGKHRRPDGTFDKSAMARELGLARPTLVNRLDRLLAGHYGPAPVFPDPAPQPAPAKALPAPAGRAGWSARQRTSGEALRPPFSIASVRR